MIFFLKIQKAYLSSAIFFPKHHSQTLPTKNRTFDIIYFCVCLLMMCVHVCVHVCVCDLYVIYTQHCKHT